LLKWFRLPLTIPNPAPHLERRGILCLCFFHTCEYVIFYTFDI
jgi:hypothetical protein